MLNMKSGATKRAGALILLVAMVFTLCAATAFAAPPTLPPTLLPDPPTEPGAITAPITVEPNEDGSIQVLIPASRANDEKIYIVIRTFPDAMLDPGVSLLTADFSITNQTGNVYKLENYYFQAGRDIKNIQRTLNEDLWEYEDEVMALELDQYYDALYTYYSAADKHGDFLANSATSQALRENVFKAIKDMTQGNVIYDANVTAPSDLVDMLVFYLFNVTRLTLDQDNHPITGLEGNGAYPQNDPHTIYSYLYRENEDLMLGDFLPSEIGAAGYESEWAFCFDGPDITNAYQGVALDMSLVLVLSTDPKPIPTPVPTPGWTTRPNETPAPPATVITPPTAPIIPPTTGDGASGIGIMLVVLAAFLMVLGILLRRRRADEK